MDNSIHNLSTCDKITLLTEIKKHYYLYKKVWTPVKIEQLNQLIIKEVRLLSNF